MEFYTVVNRTGETLSATWDGRPYTLGPHAEGMFPELVALAFKRQNVKMGSLDPRTGKIEFLAGIKEKGDPITPTEQTDAVEVWDREKLTGAKPSEIVPGDNGLYATREWKREQPLDSNFTRLDS
jgi:hypothetical protein